MIHRSPLVLLVSALLVVPLVAPVPAAAQSPRTYYVATTGAQPTSNPEPGNCEGGTADAPWGQPFTRSDGAVFHPIEYAMRCLTGGDELIIAGGTYDDRVLPFLTEDNRGTASAPVTIRVPRGQRAVIRGLLRLDQPSHWHLSGLSITSDGQEYGTGEYLLKVRGGVGWSYTGGEIWGTRSRSFAAVRVERSTPDVGPNVAPANWSFTGNCVHDTADVNAGDVDHNVYVWTGPDGGPGLIERNVIFGAPGGHNIKLGDGGGTSFEQGTANVTVRYNTLFGALQNVLVLGSSHHNVIERNTMGHVLGKEWYPNVRGRNMSGDGNVARHNAAYTGNARGGFVFVGADEGSSTTVAAHDNHFPADLQFDSPSCHGLYPRNAFYRGYGAYAPSSAASGVIQRVAGAGRIETAIEISKASFPASDSAGTVVVARADTYPDALAGGPFARALDAPILLSERDRLTPAVGTEVDRLGADRAILLGGEAALSDQVRQDLEARGLTVQRVAGIDRFSTAARIGQEMASLDGTNVQHAYVVEGANADPKRGWPDAVAVGSLAAAQGRPILLVTNAELPQATKDALGALSVSDASVIGGTAAVSTSVEQAIENEGAATTRIAGGSRYATSHAIAQVALSAGADRTRTWFATGQAFPDALAAGPAVAKDGGVLLLVPGRTSELPQGVIDWLERFGHELTRLTLIGGEAAVSTGIEDKSRYLITYR